jgi:transporter family protein
MPSWIIYALLSAIFAAGVAVFGKMGVTKVDAVLATTVRAAIMIIFLFLVTLTLGKFSLLNTLDNKALKFIVLSGISGALSWLFYFLALKSGPVTGVAALDRMSLVFVLILSALLLGESITLKSVAAVILMVSGAVLLIIKP